MTVQIPRADLIRWLDTYLDIHGYSDSSNNGLQIEGSEQISRLAVSVDSSLHVIQEAVSSGAQLLITHHGLFWGQPLMLTGAHRKRVGTALEGDLNTYAAHLPLDAHPEVGNNIMIARALGLENVTPFGKHRGGRTIGFQGELPLPLEITEFADRIQKLTGETCLAHVGGVRVVQRVGIVSGDASGHLLEAREAGLDTFVTGEPRHATYHDSFENGMNAIYAGHYETEVFGVRALAARLEEEFGLPWQFIHAPTGL